MNKRIVVAVAGLSVAALLLTGCSALSSLTGQSQSTPTASASPSHSADAAPTTKPVAGQCWTTTLAKAQAWLDWLGSAAESCSTAHSLYTYAVPTMSGKLPSSLYISADNKTLAPAVQTAGGTACVAQTTKAFPDMTWNQALLQTFFFTPSETQWKAGARWVRCDLGVIALGTTVAGEKLAAMPSSATIVAELKSSPTTFEYCVDTDEPATVAPWEVAEAKIVDCRGSAQWRYSNAHGDLPGGSTAEWPTGEKMQSESAAICDKSVPDGETAVADTPLFQDWAAGDRAVTCWNTSQSGAGGTGGIV